MKTVANNFDRVLVLGSWNYFAVTINATGAINVYNWAYPYGSLLAYGPFLGERPSSGTAQREGSPR